MKTQSGGELTGQEMCQMLDEFCNGSTSKHHGEFVVQLTQRTHRTLQQKIMGLFISCIEAWATQTSFDARNEATINLCKKIIAATGDKYDRCLPYI
jgi:hypothetical protein